MTTSALTISPAARAHIQRQLHQTQASYLRLGVKESGCNGYMYTLDFLDTPAEQDELYDFGEGIQVCVARDDLHLVTGTEIDLLTSGLNSAMIFKNPKATSYCGCGESFAVGEPSAAQSASSADLATRIGD